MGDRALKFELATPARILFGEGRLAEVGDLARGFGERALLVEGASGRCGDQVVDLLRRSQVDVATRANVAGEPTTALVERVVDEARAARCDVVVAIGGGSVIDAAKAGAAMLTNEGELLDYLEVVGRGRALAEPSAPLIAIPTTAGTGAEVTRNAVLMVEERRVKVSLRSPLMLPAVALVDPELTYPLPPAITASTGMDALTQCIEPFVSPHANPLTDGFAREGMQRAAGALRRAFEDGGDVEARRDMAIASLCGGLALANAKLGAVHGFAGPLGGMFPVPHGVACARLLPGVVAANLAALRERAPTSPALARYDEIARILTGRTDARADDAVAWLVELCDVLEIPFLGAYGLTAEAIPLVSAQARKASSMQGNPIELTDRELNEVLAAARGSSR